VKVYRIAQHRHATSPESMLSGHGARQHGGRWNSPGVPAVYCSENLSLAALEILVHVPRPAIMHRYAFVEVDVRDAAVRHIGDRELNAIARSQAFGDALLRPDGQLAFSVPSAVNPLERNVILNPRHADYRQVIRIGKVQPFPFDKRLLER
jgi:RES domain-containing protein